MDDQKKSETEISVKNIVTIALRVPIKDELRHAKPFDNALPSNIINAVILSFVGRKSVVYYLLQILCNKSRAYYFY